MSNLALAHAVAHTIDYSEDVGVDIPEAFQELFIPWRFKVFHGGRGSAKSWSVARALVTKAHSSYEKILCCREYQSKIKDSSKATIERQIKLMGLEAYFEITLTEIRSLITGSVFIFLGLYHNPDTIKSLEGVTICWVEEANSTSQNSLDVLLPTIRDPGSEIWFTFNRKFATDPVDKMFLDPENKRPNAYVRQVNYDENPHFTEELRDEMEWDKAHDFDKYQHIWLGKPLFHSEANVFAHKWRIDDSIEAREDATFYYGADWGFSNDPSTLLRCWVDDKKREICVDYEAYKVGVEIDDLPEFYKKVPDSDKWQVRADNARPETISYMKRHGFPKLVPCKKGPGSIEDGITFLTSYTIVVHSRCINLTTELGLYSYKKDPKTNEILPIIIDKHNHMIDALRYALEKLFFKGAFKWDVL